MLLNDVLFKKIVNLTIILKLVKMMTYQVKKGEPMKIDHALFMNTLRAKGLTQKAFANYAKISYDTVTGWKKKGKVPTYATVIAKDMAYRQQLDEQAKMQMKRRFKDEPAIFPHLLPKEKKRIEAAFWGSNYTAGEIVQKVGQGDEKFMKQFRQNVPQDLQQKVMDSLRA
jgi:transcriptional regulator with XRE-family HTH domain